MTNYLIIGYGNISKRHLNNLSKIKKKKIIFILTRKKNIINNNKSVFFINDISEIDQRYFDSIFICTGSNEHIKTANRYLKYSNNIFIEKPLSNNLDNLKKFINNVKKKNINIFIGYNLIFLESLIKLKKIIQKNKKNLIKINVKTSYDLRLWRNNFDYKNSVSASKEKGGGVLLELSHDLHYLIWMLGKPKWVICHLSKLSNLSVNVEDNAFLIVGFRDVIVNVELDFINKFYQREVSLLTDKTFYKWNYKKNSIIKIVKNKKKLVFKSNKNFNHTYIDELKFFLNEKGNNFKLLDIAFLTNKLIHCAKISNLKNSKKVII